MELNFEKRSKTAKNFDSKTPKRQPLNLSETSRDTPGVHQRATDLQSFYYFFLLSQPDPQL